MRVGMSFAVVRLTRKYRNEDSEDKVMDYKIQLFWYLFSSLSEEFELI